MPETGKISEYLLEALTLSRGDLMDVSVPNPDYNPLDPASFPYLTKKVDIEVILDLIEEANKSGIHFPFRFAGQSYNASINGVAKTPMTLVANTIYANPIKPEDDIITTSFSLFISTAVVGSTFRFLVFSENMLLVWQSANVDSSTTGLKSVLQSFTFLKGVKYYLAIYSGSAIGVRSIPVNGLVTLATVGISANQLTIITATAGYPTLTLGTNLTGLAGYALASNSAPDILLTP